MGNVFHPEQPSTGRPSMLPFRRILSRAVIRQEVFLDFATGFFKGDFPSSMGSSRPIKGLPLRLRQGRRSLGFFYPQSLWPAAQLIPAWRESKSWDAFESAQSNTLSRATAINSSLLYERIQTLTRAK